MAHNQGSFIVHLPDIELHEADTLEQAAKLMRRYAPDARLLAGGTDLLIDLKAGRVSVRHVVSINRLNALRGVAATDGGLRLGALTTIAELAASPLVREGFVSLLDAASRMAAPQVRNLATVGGNIAAAVPCADLPPVLMVLGASVVMWSAAGERQVPLESFFVGPRQTVLQKEEVLTAILVPQAPPRFGAAYARFQLREGNAVAVASVAAGLLLNADDTIRHARIALGAVAPVPKLAQSAGDLLAGKRPDDRSFEAASVAAMEATEPISDIRGSAEHRRQVVGILTRRALAAAHQRAGEAGE